MAATVLLIAVVAASRVYLQVHDPSDVLGGFLLGIGWIALAQKILLKYLYKSLQSAEFAPNIYIELIQSAYGL